MSFAPNPFDAEGEVQELAENFDGLVFQSAEQILGATLPEEEEAAEAAAAGGDHSFGDGGVAFQEMLKATNTSAYFAAGPRGGDATSNLDFLPETMEDDPFFLQALGWRESDASLAVMGDSPGREEYSRINKLEMSGLQEEGASTIARHVMLGALGLSPDAGPVPGSGEHYDRNQPLLQRDESITPTNSGGSSGGEGGAVVPARSSAAAAAATAASLLVAAGADPNRTVAEVAAELADELSYSLVMGIRDQDSPAASPGWRQHQQRESPPSPARQPHTHAQQQQHQQHQQRNSPPSPARQPHTHAQQHQHQQHQQRDSPPSPARQPHTRAQQHQQRDSPPSPARQPHTHAQQQHQQRAPAAHANQSVRFAEGTYDNEGGSASGTSVPASMFGAPAPAPAPAAAAAADVSRLSPGNITLGMNETLGVTAQLNDLSRYMFERPTAHSADQQGRGASGGGVRSNDLSAIVSKEEVRRRELESDGDDGSDVNGNGDADLGVGAPSLANTCAVRVDDDQVSPGPTPQLDHHKILTLPLESVAQEPRVTPRRHASVELAEDIMEEMQQEVQHHMASPTQTNAPRHHASIELAAEIMEDMQKEIQHHHHHAPAAEGVDGGVPAAHYFTPSAAAAVAVAAATAASPASRTAAAAGPTYSAEAVAHVAAAEGGRSQLSPQRHASIELAYELMNEMKQEAQHHMAPPEQKTGPQRHASVELAAEMMEDMQRETHHRYTSPTHSRGATYSAAAAAAVASGSARASPKRHASLELANELMNEMKQEAQHHMAPPEQTTGPKRHASVELASEIMEDMQREALHDHASPAQVGSAFRANGSVLEASRIPKPIESGGESNFAAAEAQRDAYYAATAAAAAAPLSPARTGYGGSGGGGPATPSHASRQRHASVELADDLMAEMRLEAQHHMAPPDQKSGPQRHASVELAAEIMEDMQREAQHDLHHSEIVDTPGEQLESSPRRNSIQQHRPMSSTPAAGLSSPMDELSLASDHASAISADIDALQAELDEVTAAASPPQASSVGGKARTRQPSLSPSSKSPGAQSDVSSIVGGLDDVSSVLARVMATKDRVNRLLQSPGLSSPGSADGSPRSVTRSPTMVDGGRARVDNADATAAGGGTGTGIASSAKRLVNALVDAAVNTSMARGVDQGSGSGGGGPAATTARYADAATGVASGEEFYGGSGQHFYNGRENVEDLDETLASNFGNAQEAEDEENPDLSMWENEDLPPRQAAARAPSGLQRVQHAVPVNDSLMGNPRSQRQAPVASSSPSRRGNTPLLHPAVTLLAGDRAGSLPDLSDFENVSGSDTDTAATNNVGGSGGSGGGGGGTPLRMHAAADPSTQYRSLPEPARVASPAQSVHSVASYASLPQPPSTANIGTNPMTPHPSQQASGVRIDVPRGLASHFVANPGDESTLCIPVRNSGVGPVSVAVSLSDDANCFHCSPAVLEMEAGDISQVEVTFAPAHAVGSLQAHLNLVAGPAAQLYQISLTASSAGEYAAPNTAVQDDVGGAASAAATAAAAAPFSGRGSVAEAAATSRSSSSTRESDSPQSSQQYRDAHYHHHRHHHHHHGSRKQQQQQQQQQQQHRHMHSSDSTSPASLPPSSPAPSTGSMASSVEHHHQQQQDGGPNSLIQLLCSQPVVAWTAVKQRTAETQEVTFRNNSMQTRLEIVISIGQDNAGVFRFAGLAASMGSQGQALRNTLAPQEQCSVKIQYAPTQCRVSHAALLVTARVIAGGNDVGGKPTMQKFNIPMVGYAGSSSIVVEGTRISGDRHHNGAGGLSIGSLKANKLYTMTTILKNKGERAAYVRAVFTDAEGNALPSKKGKISPPCLVVQAHRSRSLRVSFRMSESDFEQLAHHQKHTHGRPGTLALIKLYTGDELIRTHFRQTFRHSGANGGMHHDQHHPSDFDDMENGFPFESFDCNFDGEELVRFGPDVRDDRRGRGVALGFGSLDALQFGTSFTQLAIVGSVPPSRSVAMPLHADLGAAGPAYVPAPYPRQQLHQQHAPPRQTLVPVKRYEYKEPTPPRPGQETLVPAYGATVTIPKVSPARSDTTVVLVHSLGTKWSVAPDTLRFKTQDAQYFTIRNDKPSSLDFNIVSTPAYTLVCTPVFRNDSSQRRAERSSYRACRWKSDDAGCPEQDASAMDTVPPAAAAAEAEAAGAANAATSAAATVE
eukprot:gene176-2971_t